MPVYAGTVFIDRNLHEVQIGRHVEYFIDTTSSLGIKEVASKDIKWNQLSKDYFFYGFKDAACWFRLTVSNTSQVPVKWYLLTRRYYYDSISLYLLKKDGTYTVKKTGDLYSFATRDVADRNFVFAHMQFSGKKQIYLRIKNKGSVYLSPSIVSLDKYLYIRGRDAAVLWSLQGILVTIFIMVSAIAIISRDRQYLYFAAAIASISFFQIVLTGYGFQYLWPDSPRWANTSVPFSISLVLFANSIFPLSFLELRERLPWGRLLLLGAAFAAVMCVFLSFIGFYSITAQIIAFLVVVVALSLFVIAVVLAVRGLRQAWFYLAGFSIFIAGGMIYAMELLELIPVLSLNYWLFQFGIVFFSIILSLGLIDKVNVLQKFIMHLNEGLEEKVHERTRELSETNRNLEQQISVREQTEEELKVALEEKTVLLKEVHHRVKNNLNIVNSFLMLQEYVVEDEKTVEALQDAQSRIRSISTVHEMIYRSSSISKLTVKDYLENLLDMIFGSYSVASERIQLVSSIEDLAIDINKAIPLGILLNEIVTNSLKHAFPNNRSGKITVAVTKAENGRCILEIQDNGIGIPKDIDSETSTGIGLQLIEELVKQLDGTLEKKVCEGTCYVIEFPNIT